MADPTCPSGAVNLADERFVALTSCRRDGTRVPTPVWVVDDNGVLLVWTGAETGKVTRVGRDPRVDLAPCSRLGRVAADAAHVSGCAVASADPALQQCERLLKAKYRLEYRLVRATERLLLRARIGERVVLRVTPD